MDPGMLGALLAGLVIGTIPAISGAVKGKLGLGLGGFVTCIVGSIVLGMLLSIPACAIFMYLIFKKSNENSMVTTEESDLAWIKELQELRDSGALTETEFQESKSKALH